MLSLVELEHRVCILLQLLGFDGFLLSPFFGGEPAALAGDLLVGVSEIYLAVRARIGISLPHVTLPGRVSKSTFKRDKQRKRVEALAYAAASSGDAGVAPRVIWWRYHRVCVNIVVVGGTVCEREPVKSTPNR